MKTQSLFILALSASTLSGFGAVTSFSNRAALGANDLIDWSSAGAAFDAFPSGPVTTTGGLTPLVSVSGGTPLQRVNEGDLLLDGWTGNFNPGERLVWTDLEPGPLFIDFSSPIIGGGAQIQAQIPGSFTAMIEAFDSIGGSLGSFLFKGNSTFDQDGSAIFIGLKSDTADISRLAFSITDSSDNSPEPLTDFALNQVSLVTPEAVPEVGTLWGGFALAAFAGLQVFKARRNA